MFNSILSRGDLPVFFEGAIKDLSLFPLVWSPTNGNGLGQNVSFVLGYKTFFNFISKFFVEFLGISWPVAEKLIFFIPVFILSFISSYLFSSHFFKSSRLKIVAALIFSVNSYSLMIIAGGQVGVSFAYALAPLVLYFLLSSSWNRRKFIGSSIFSALLLLIDPRVFGLTLLVAFILVSLNFYMGRASFKSFLPLLFSLFISVLLNAFWIVPFALVSDLSLSTAYTESGIIKFLSFAFFENTISLLHPNYPENIFGKVYFMKPEFLIVPILSFIPIFLIKNFGKKERGSVIGFSSLALIGAFLAKGVNEPFGFIYQFLSDYVPGFILFRDPTKFYLLVALSFSVLIPISLDLISKKLKNKRLIIPIFLIFWFVLLRHIFILGDGGVFKPKNIEEEYIRFAQMLGNDKEFYRTFWIPQWQSYGYFSNTHPAVSANDYFKKTELEEILKLSDLEESLSDRSIRYVIVPYDQNSEIFLTDRKYDPKKFDQAIDRLREFSWLKELEGFNKLKVFEINSSKGRFWMESGSVSHSSNSPVEHEVSISSAKKETTLIFSESYSNNWKAVDQEGNVIFSKDYRGLNSFLIPQAGNYELTIEYEGQKYVDYGLLISIASLGVLLISLLLPSKVWKSKLNMLK